MRLLISSVIFVITLSGLFLFENLNKQKDMGQQAQIQNFLEQQSTTGTETPRAETAMRERPTSLISQTQTTAFNPIATTASTPAPTRATTPLSTDGSTTAKTPTPAPTRTPTPVATLISTPSPTQTKTPLPSPTPAPVSTPTPTPQSSPQATEMPTPSATPEPTPRQLEKININTASLGELDNITGVGLVIGQRIIDYRNINGPFQKIEDIKKIKGIGDITFEKMRNEITI
jgi:competence ComEA-like helix-hairpin-helix protein